MQVLTAKEACGTLRICRTTLWNLRKKGELKGFNVGGKVLFTDDEIKAYIADRQRQSGMGGCGNAKGKESKR